MRVIETKAYQYDELDEKAKEKARDWYLQGAFDFDWYDCIYEDAKTIGLKIEEFDCYRGTIDGKLLKSPTEVCSAIIANHGKTCDTYKFAVEYFAEKRKRRKHIADNQNDVDDFRRALLEEYLSMLRKEIEYMESKEYIEEGIRANEYEFNEGGKRI